MDIAKLLSEAPVPPVLRSHGHHDHHRAAFDVEQYHQLHASHAYPPHPHHHHHQQHYLPWQFLSSHDELVSPCSQDWQSPSILGSSHASGERGSGGGGGGGSLSSASSSVSPSHAVPLMSWTDNAYNQRVLPVYCSTQMSSGGSSISSASSGSSPRSENRLLHLHVPKSSSHHHHHHHHGNKKAFHCRECGKGFTQRADCNRHERIHGGARPYVCPHPGCGKDFIQSSALKVHIRTHTGEKPHMCEQCSKLFASSSALARHRHIHSGSRPFKCPFANCQKTFTRRATLVRHHERHSGTVEDAATATAMALAGYNGNSGPTEGGGRDRSLSLY